MIDQFSNPKLPLQVVFQRKKESVGQCYPMFVMQFTDKPK